MKKILMVAIASIAVVSMTSCGSSSAKPTDGKTNDNVIVVDSKSDEKTWEYDSKTDKMGSTTQVAGVLANDLVNLEFPYNGGSQAKLLIRKENGPTEILFVIDKGQIDTDMDGTYIKIKFDDEAPKKWSMSTSSDGSRDVLFFNNETALLKKIKESKKIVLEVPFYQNGSQQFVFNTADLKW
jgi:hypothetical protein